MPPCASSSLLISHEAQRPPLHLADRVRMPALDDNLDGTLLVVRDARALPLPPPLELGGDRAFALLDRRRVGALPAPVRTLHRELLLTRLGGVARGDHEVHVLLRFDRAQAVTLVERCHACLPLAQRH
eukprot:TRINITY_DN25294_c0_g1_i1.p3 TRINITY_DN25294_c0_g1~~TRINITY_DN25294_c0_g1_i1.p3  ORF type:complete len:128 (+),score=6.14 TRINITY_DN25294_c0_g1_i1:220-603(+)